jgi:imidazolonepropionase-like amidohydrolase
MKQESWISQYIGVRFQATVVIVFCLSFLVSCKSPNSNNNAPPHYTKQAYTGVNIVNVEKLEVEKDMTILIDNGIITEIVNNDRFNADDQTEIIDATGKWALPGLIDMHAHVTVLPIDSNFRVVEKFDRNASEESLKTMLAFGITTVRNPAAPTDDGVLLKDLVEKDSIISPTIFTTGFALNRTKAFFGPFAATPNENEIRSEIQDQVDKGVDFIKVYASLKPDQIKIAIDEAHQHEIDVIGHLQNTSWTEASELGIDFITHAAPWHKEYLPEELRHDYRPTFLGRIFWLEHVDYDDQPIQDMIASLVKNNVSIDPTLIAFHTKFWGDDDRYVATPSLELAPALVTNIWKSTTFTDGWSKEDYERSRGQWGKLAELTKRMHDSGVLITTGSDYPNPWVIPGLSLHQEMHLMLACGISPIEVIRIATLNGAKALGIDDQIGSISEGKQADILFVNSSPIIDIKNTMDVFMVINDGKRYEPTKLNQNMQQFLERIQNN